MWNFYARGRCRTLQSAANEDAAMFLCKRTCFNIHIVPPLGIFKSQLGGHIGYRCCFILSLTPVILYIYMFHLILFCWCLLHERYIPCQQFDKLFWASVCVWTIWTDVKLLSVLILSATLICRGHAAIMQTHANEAMHDGGSRGWSPLCTCKVVITCCSGSDSYVILLYFAITASEWHQANPRTGTSNFDFLQETMSNLFRWLRCFCTYDTFHFKIRNDHSEQVCDDNVW